MKPSSKRAVEQIEVLREALRAIEEKEVKPRIEPKVMTVDEAGQALRLGRTMLYELMNSGALRSIKVGKRRLVPVDAIDEFLAKAVA